MNPVRLPRSAYLCRMRSYSNSVFFGSLKVLATCNKRTIISAGETSIIWNNAALWFQEQFLSNLEPHKRAAVISLPTTTGLKMWHTGRSLAESLLQASHPSEAIAMAMKGAELTVAERERLRKEEDLARQQWNQRTRAKQIFNEAAAQMESKGDALDIFAFAKFPNDVYHLPPSLHGLLRLLAISPSGKTPDEEILAYYTLSARCTQRASSLLHCLSPF